MTKRANLCINCNASLTGNYCHQCGQPTNISKISLRSLIRDFNEKFFGLDTKFGRTLKAMIISPGTVSSSFIAGNRVSFMGPVSFCFLMLTIYVLLATFLDIDIEKATEGTSELFASDETTSKQQEAVLQIRNFMFDNFRLISLLLVPFLAFGQWLIYRKERINYFEHASVTLYIHGEALIFTIITLIVFYFSGISIQLFSTIIGLIYSCYALSVMYSGNKIINFIKGIFVHVIGVFLYIATATIFILLFKNVLFD